ncbi:MAG: hypothetical protein KAG61_11300, partial [Bacteriovoracaceae bacterium]|nr:hypothetical protein [Bacteriovoracaceae bacterium]
KSRLGKGRIKLEVDNTTSFSHQVGGYPSEFHDRDAYTFYRTKIINPAYSSRGRWNLLLSGNFKLRKIIVNLNRANSYDDFEPVPRIRFTKVGTLQFSKMYEETKRVRIAKDNVKVIKIKSLRNAVRLLDVEVVFRNGNTRFLSELEGVILNGRTKEITFRNVRDIQTLRITAVPRMTNYGERGTLQVSVGKLRR